MTKSRKKQTNGGDVMSRQKETDLTPEVCAMEAALAACEKVCDTYGKGSPEGTKARETLEEDVRRIIARLYKIWLAQAEIGTPH